MNVLLAALGSHGDVHPFVGIGLALRARGHRVRVIANPYFASLIEGVGLELIPLGTAEEYVRLAKNPDLWRRIRGLRTVLSGVALYIRPMYRAIAQKTVPGETIVAASTLALGARVAEDQLKIPSATVHLQPSIFRSVIDPPHLQGLYMPRGMPAWMKRVQYGAVDWVVDPLIAPSLNEFRRELGLAAVRSILGSYVHSPRRVIGLFPGWYAPPPPDWPPQTRLTGFPLYDERGHSSLDPVLVSFLNEGDPPIAFTPGSAMWSGHSFFEHSARACELLGKRGLLLTRHREHLPPSLPRNVIHVEFAPFSELLPKCAALVHHGGIGTTAQALASGIPQVVVPHAHDQPDNAHRVVGLGVGRKLEPKEFRAPMIARVLTELLGSSEVKSRCRDVMRRFAGVDPIAQSCDLIEGLAPQRLVPRG